MHRDSCLELYYCNMVEWFWWDSSLIFDDQLVSFSALTLLVWSSGCKNCLHNDLLCVEWDVKPLRYYYYYVITRSFSYYIKRQTIENDGDSTVDVTAVFSRPVKIVLFF